MLGILILHKNIQKELKKTDKKITEKLDYDEIEFLYKKKILTKLK